MSQSLLILCDLEGTLSNHTERLAQLKATTALNPRDREAWKTYYKGLPQDAPHEHVIVAIRKWIRAGDSVVVYSTRFKNKYNHEEEWLRGHELRRHVTLLQRETHERAIVGPQLVAIWASELKPHILVDDREEVRELVRKCLPTVRVMGVEDFEPESTDEMQSELPVPPLDS